MPSGTDAISIISEFVPLSGRRILDIGCGGGALARSLAVRGACVFGVDPSPEALELARRAVPTGVFYPAVAQALPFEEGVFDAAVFLNSLHHVPKPAMAQAIREASRVVKTAGSIVIVEPLAKGPLFSVLRLVEDETDLRAAAQSAIDRALSSGDFEQSGHLDYLRREHFEDLAGLLQHALRVDPGRAAVIEERGSELEVAFRKYAWADDDGMSVLEQPMRARVLRRSATE